MRQGTNLPFCLLPARGTKLHTSSTEEIDSRLPRLKRVFLLIENPGQWLSSEIGWQNVDPVVCGLFCRVRTAGRSCLVGRNSCATQQLLPVSPLPLSCNGMTTTPDWQQIVRMKPPSKPPELAYKLDKLACWHLAALTAASCGATVSCLLSNLRGTGTVPRFAVVQPPDIRKPPESTRGSDPMK